MVFAIFVSSLEKAFPCLSLPPLNLLEKIILNQHMLQVIYAMSVIRDPERATIWPLSFVSCAHEKRRDEILTRTLFIYLLVVYFSMIRSPSVILPSVIVKKFYVKHFQTIKMKFYNLINGRNWSDS